MADFTLVIGNKNYSSWSLRPWLVMKHLELPFSEELIPLYEEDSAERLSHYSPSGLVPVLRHGDVLLWESLAICDYLAELYPKAELWPWDAEARAVAKSVAFEMHGGFSALRSKMPMNIRGTKHGKGRSPEVEKNIARITQIWEDARTEFGRGGDFLFGKFGIADAMFAPVATRFRTYGVELTGASADYAQALLTHPAMLEWEGAARAEPWIIAASEVE